MTGIRRLGWLSLVLGFGHVVFGAIVRITGSGMGCGEHWPKCQGYWIPPFTRPDLIIEVSHRYFAATLTTAIVALVALTWRRRKEAGVGGRGGVLRPAALAGVLVVAAALFGAVTVWLELANKLVIVTHLAIAMSLLAVLVAAVLRAGGPPRIPLYAGNTRAPSSNQRDAYHGTATWSASPPIARAATIAAALGFAVVVLGGLTANIPGANVSCLGFPLCAGNILPAASQYLQFAHRLLAFALFFVVGWIGVTLTRRGERRMAAFARVVLSLIFVQILIAVAMVTFYFPPIWRSLHEAAGTLLWVVLFAFAYVANRLASERTAARPAAAPVVPSAARVGA